MGSPSGHGMVTSERFVVVRTKVMNLQKMPPSENYKVKAVMNVRLMHVYPGV